jgi:hypothetical protein
VTGASPVNDTCGQLSSHKACRITSKECPCHCCNSTIVSLLFYFGHFVLLVLVNKWLHLLTSVVTRKAMLHGHSLFTENTSFRLCSGSTPLWSPQASCPFLKGREASTKKRQILEALPPLPFLAFGCPRNLMNQNSQVPQRFWCYWRRPSLVASLLV